MTTLEEILLAFLIAFAIATVFYWFICAVHNECEERIKHNWDIKDKITPEEFKLCYRGYHYEPTLYGLKEFLKDAGWFDMANDRLRFGYLDFNNEKVKHVFNDMALAHYDSIIGCDYTVDGFKQLWDRHYPNTDRNMEDNNHGC